MDVLIEYVALSLMIIAGSISVVACIHVLKLESRRRKVNKKKRSNEKGLLLYELKFTAISREGVIKIISSDEKRCIAYAIICLVVYIGSLLFI